jgi:uncharacterized SAM-binding protein YcdF (DUF218 family)
MINRVIRGVRTLLALTGLAVLAVTFTPLVPWCAAKLAGPWNDSKGDVLVVLSASDEQFGLLARDSYLRARYAVLNWRGGHYRKVIVCGRDAGPVMRDYLVFSGIPAASVVVEDRSQSTRENALFAAPILNAEPGRRILLTSDFHMFRAIRAFRKAGVEVEPLPVPDVRKYASQRTWRLPLSWTLATELAKIAYYRWKGWI